MIVPDQPFMPDVLNGSYTARADLCNGRSALGASPKQAGA